MAERVMSTPDARALIARLKERHGPLVCHQSGGCCDGSAPMCYRDGDFRIDEEAATPPAAGQP